ncbi:MAG: lysophospholipid acyltransferase family protein [Planctomycetaceae bacterium]
MKLRNRTIIRLAARFLAFVFRNLLRTVRLHAEYAEPRSSCYEDTGDERHLFCLWHDGIIGHVFSLPAFRVSALVSQHGDGDWLADALEAIGVAPIRGSSRRGGAAALRQMLDAARDFHIAIATDGPMGPRREVKDGIVYLASQTGRAIVPAGFAAKSALRPVGRWTDLTIPLPFTDTYMCVGPRMYVPPGLDREQLEPYRLQVQAAMDALQAEADRRAGDDSTARWASITPRAKVRRKPEQSQRRAA